MQLLNAMQVCEGKRKALPFLGTDELIDVNRMNRLIALVIATTVAKGLPASGDTCEKHIRHDGHPWCGTDASHGAWRGSRHHRLSALQYPALFQPSGVDYG